MSRARKTFSNEFKAKVALEAIKGYKSLNELAAEYQVHPNAIGNWKKQALESFPEIFNNRRGPKAQIDTELTDQLYKQIGKQQVELDWLKKKLNTIS
jgi:transposase-like protein